MDEIFVQNLVYFTIFSFLPVTPSLVAGFVACYVASPVRKNHISLLQQFILLFSSLLNFFSLPVKSEDAAFSERSAGNSPLSFTLFSCQPWLSAGFPPGVWKSAGIWECFLCNSAWAANGPALRVNTSRMYDGSEFLGDFLQFNGVSGDLLIFLWTRRTFWCLNRSVLWKALCQVKDDFR